MMHTRRLLPAKAGNLHKSLANQGRRASRLSLATKSHAFGVNAIFFLILVSGPTTNAQQIKNAVPYQARPLPLSAVRITGGPLKHAQDLDAQYLLKLEPDRMLAYYRKRAGLEPKAAGYGVWDGDGRNLTGHIAGHYLSAVSLMYAATGDIRFKQRADYIVSALKEVCVGEMPYDALHEFIPMYHAGGGLRWQKYSRFFQHLSSPAPGRGSSGVHESGFGRFNSETLSLSPNQFRRCKSSMIRSQSIGTSWQQLSAKQKSAPELFRGVTFCPKS